MTDPTFAQPLAKLSDSSIGVTIAPAGGKGLALDDKGMIPRSVLNASGVVYVPDGVITDRKVQFGNATVTWPGGANASSYTTVTHSLGSTPVVVVATNTSGPTGYCEVQSIGATTFQVRTVDPLATPAAATTGTLSYICLG